MVTMNLCDEFEIGHHRSEEGAENRQDIGDNDDDDDEEGDDEEMMEILRAYDDNLIMNLVRNGNENNNSGANDSKEQEDGDEDAQSNTASSIPSSIDLDLGSFLDDDDAAEAAAAIALGEEREAGTTSASVNNGNKSDSRCGGSVMSDLLSSALSVNQSRADIPQNLEEALHMIDELNLQLAVAKHNERSSRIARQHAQQVQSQNNTRRRSTSELRNFMTNSSNNAQEEEEEPTVNDHTTCSRRNVEDRILKASLSSGTLGSSNSFLGGGSLDRSKASIAEGDADEDDGPGVPVLTTQELRDLLSRCHLAERERNTLKFNYTNLHRQHQSLFKEHSELIQDNHEYEGLVGQVMEERKVLVEKVQLLTLERDELKTQANGSRTSRAPSAVGGSATSAPQASCSSTWDLFSKSKHHGTANAQQQQDAQKQLENTRKEKEVAEKRLAKLELELDQTHVAAETLLLERNFLQQQVRTLQRHTKHCVCQAPLKLLPFEGSSVVNVDRTSPGDTEDLSNSPKTMTTTTGKAVATASAATMGLSAAKIVLRRATVGAIASSLGATPAAKILLGGCSGNRKQTCSGSVMQRRTKRRLSLNDNVIREEDVHSVVTAQSLPCRFPKNTNQTDGPPAHSNWYLMPIDQEEASNKEVCEVMEVDVAAAGHNERASLTRQICSRNSSNQSFAAAAAAVGNPSDDISALSGDVASTCLSMTTSFDQEGGAAAVSGYLRQRSSTNDLTSSSKALAASVDAGGAVKADEDGTSNLAYHVKMNRSSSALTSKSVTAIDRKKDSLMENNADAINNTSSTQKKEAVFTAASGAASAAPFLQSSKRDQNEGVPPHPYGRSLSMSFITTKNEDTVTHLDEHTTLTLHARPISRRRPSLFLARRFSSFANTSSTTTGSGGASVASSGGGSTTSSIGVTSMASAPVGGFYSSRPIKTGYRKWPTPQTQGTIDEEGEDAEEH